MSTNVETEELVRLAERAQHRVKRSGTIGIWVNLAAVVVGAAWIAFTLVKVDSANAEAVAAEGRAKKAEGDVQEAEDELKALQQEINDALEAKALLEERAKQDHQTLEKIQEIAEEQTGTAGLAEVKELVAPALESPRVLASTEWQKGYEAFKRGEYATARQHYGKSVDLDGSYAPPHNSLGRILATENKYKEAIDYYRRALARDPKYAPALNNIGWAHYKLKAFDEAARACEKTLRLQPDYPATVKLQKALEKMDDPSFHCKP